MRCINLASTRLLGFAAAVLPAAALAHSDVLVRSDGGSVVIGAAEDLDMEEGGPFFDLDTDVFEGVLINPDMPTSPFDYDFERDEPGFYSDPSVPVGQNLPMGADVALTLRTFTLPSGTDNTFYWDGADEVDFQPLSVAQPSAAFTFAPMSPEPFAMVDDSAFLDDHPLFGLTGGAADGVYLTKMQVEVESLDPSDGFYMVWLANSVLTSEGLAEELEEALELYEEGGPAPVVGGVDFSFFEEAVEYVDQIPEPSTLLLALTAAVGLAAVRRR